MTAPAADRARSDRRPRPQLRAGRPSPPGGEKEVSTLKSFLKRMWYSPVLLLVVVFVLSAPRKVPGKP